MTTIPVLVGSLRRDSFSRKVALALGALVPELNFKILDIGSVEPFNQDLEIDPPPGWKTLREGLADADGVLFVTPEYNRSIPGVLKNAVDVASRPYGRSVLAGKPAAIISTSIGALGGFGANHHLRQTLAFLNMPTLAQPEAYVGNTMGLFDESGQITNETTAEFLIAFGKAFGHFIEHNGAVVAGRSAA